MARQWARSCARSRTGGSARIFRATRRFSLPSSPASPRLPKTRGPQRPLPRAHKKEAAGIAPAASIFLNAAFAAAGDLEVHAAHAAHSAATAHRHGWSILLRALGDHRFSRDQEAGDGGRVLKRAAHDLRRVDDAVG